MTNNQDREVILRVKHLKQFFKMGNAKLKAVNDISFDVYKGETFSLVGESGSGKTTIGRAIVRINPLAKGEIRFKGKRISGVPFEEKNAGVYTNRHKQDDWSV